MLKKALKYPKLKMSLYLDKNILMLKPFVYKTFKLMSSIIIN